MKIKKRFVAFMMAILMVLTSITIQYRKSEAATVTATITVNFDAKDENKAVKVTVGDKSFEGTVTKSDILNEDGTASGNYKYQVTGELEAETGAKTAVVTYDNGNSVYSAQTALTIPDTADEAGKYAVETGDVTLLLTTVKEVTVTGVDGYTFTSVTGATRVGNSMVFVKNDGTPFNLNDKFTIIATKADAQYSATVQVVEATIDLGKLWKLDGYSKVTLQNDASNYVDIAIADTSYVIENPNAADKKIIKADGTLIHPNAEIAFSAKGRTDGFSYSGKFSVGSEAKVVVSDSGWITSEYKLNLNLTSGIKAQYSVKKSDGTYQEYQDVNNNTIFDSNKTYKLKFTASKADQVLVVTGLNGSGTSYDQDPWIQEWESDEFSSNPGSITVSERTPKVTNVAITPTNIIPEVERTVDYVVETEAGYPVSKYDFDVKLYEDETCNTEIKDAKISKKNVAGNKPQVTVTLPYNNTNKKYENIYIAITVGGVTKQATLKVVVGDIQYGKDYSIDDPKGIYSSDGTGKYFYYNGGKIRILNKGEYTQYRFGKNGAILPDEFTDITSDSVIEPSDGINPLAIQMKSDSQFGEIAGIGLFKDDISPVVKFSNSGDYQQDENSRITLKEDSKLKFEVYDENGKEQGVAPAIDKYSGISRVYFVYEGSTEENEITPNNGTYELAAKNNLDKNKHTIKVYAVDNVGNVSEECKVNYDIDAAPPEIFLDADKAFLTYEGEDNTFYYSVAKNGNGSIKFTVTDEHFVSENTTCKIKKDGTEKNIDLSLNDKKDEGSFQCEFGESYSDGVYQITVTSKDNAGNEVTKTYKVIVDNTKPEISSATAIPVQLPVDGDFKDFSKSYIAYNAGSSIKVEFSDKNIDTSNAVTSGLMKENTAFLVSVSNDNAEDDKYEASYSMSQLAETLDLDKNKTTITVTDKAGNKNTIDIKYNDKETLKASSKKIVVINGTTTLNSAVLDNNKFTDAQQNTENILINKNGNIISGKIEYSSNSKVVDARFLNVKLVDENGKVVVPSEKINSEIKGTDKKIVLDTSYLDELADNGKYKVVAQYLDIASCSVDSYSISIPAQSGEGENAVWYIYDNVAPKLNADFSNANGTITYTLTEKHPDFAAFDVNKKADNKVTVSNNAGTTDTRIAEQLKGAWKVNNDGTYTNVITLDTEGKYAINVTPKDKATNKGEEIEKTYIYDKTAPTLRSETAGVPTVEVKTAKETKNTDYSKFDETKAVVTVHAYDLVADSLKKSVFTLKDSTGKVITVTGDKLTEKKEKGMFTESFEIDPNFKGSLSFVLKDSNGNVSDEIKYTYANGNLKGIVVEDGEKHESVSEAWVREVNASAAENGIYNEDIKLNLYAEDMYSGLSSVSFVAMNKDDGAIIAQYSEDIESRTENSGVQYTWSKNDQVISALKKNEGNNIELWFSAQDNAGHKINAETKTVKIDVTAPKVTVTYDNNSPVNEKYFNATRTATIEVKDYNFISSGITLDIKKNGAPMNVAPNFSTDRVVKKDESGKPYYTYVMTLPFAEDGDYDFTVSARDAAGNVGTLGRTDSFTIDKTNPDMSIAFDNNNPYSGQYYGDSRTATITIKEHNFNASDVKVNVTASVDGSSVSAPSVSAFSTSGDVHTASVTFNGDADYTISASCVDLAGNEGNNIEEQSFTVDQTAPEIKITGVKADESYTGSVSPVVTVTDGNYDTEGVTVNIVGGKHGKSKVSSSVSDIAHGQTYSFADLQHTQDNDDYYTLTAKAVDKAGHETEETIAYKVNRFGSVYVMNDALQAAVDQYYATSSDKYAIIEQNVDELDSYTVSYSVDNEIVNLEENKGYKVSHKTNKEDWQEYEYKLDADTFSKEGVYNISISSKDTAGNASDNKSKNVEMEFCIDNTKPSCIISGVEENQKFDKGVAANIVVEAYDNIKFGDMQISVNGSQIKSEKDMTDGKVSFTIDPAKGDQTLKVVCHDAAGNETVQEVHFTFNMGVLNSGSPVAIIIIVIAVAAAAVIFFLIAKKKKNGK